jgi:hypothetical protein
VATVAFPAAGNIVPAGQVTNSAIRIYTPIRCSAERHAAGSPVGS